MIAPTVAMAMVTGSWSRWVRADEIGRLRARAACMVRMGGGRGGGIRGLLMLDREGGKEGTKER